MDSRSKGVQNHMSVCSQEVHVVQAQTACPREHIQPPVTHAIFVLHAADNISCGTPERHLHAGRQQARHTRVGRRTQTTHHDANRGGRCLTATARQNMGSQAVMIALNICGLVNVAFPEKRLLTPLLSPKNRKSDTTVKRLCHHMLPHQHLT